MHYLKMTANLLWSCYVLEIKDPEFIKEATLMTSGIIDKMSLEQIYSVVFYLEGTDTQESNDLMRSIQARYEKLPSEVKNGDKGVKLGLLLKKFTDREVLKSNSQVNQTITVMQVEDSEEKDEVENQTL